MSGGYTGELFPSYGAVEARREREIAMIKEKLERNEKVVTAVCRVERVSADGDRLRFGLKRGKLLYLFKYPAHDVEREKHRNVITRARYIKTALEAAGYLLVPWDFKKGEPPTFWLEDHERGGAMEEEDDDLYGPSEAAAEKRQAKDESGGEQGDEPMDEGLESGEEDEDEEESDSDIDIIIDKPATAPKPAAPQPQESKAIKIEAPPQPSSVASGKAPAAAQGPPVPSQPGTAYPAVRASTIDVNADPTYPQTGKPISQVDIDADLAESTKPWRLPGADQSDYFNYGFDEFTWEMYRQRQAGMAATLNVQKAETAQFQQMFMPGMNAPGPNAPAGGSGGVPGAPSGPSAGAGGGGGGGGMGGGGMGGMPGMNEEQMMQMMAQMQASGMDPSTMDFNTFMQMAGGMGMGGPGFGNQPQGPQGGGGRGGGGGRRGRGGW